MRPADPTKAKRCYYCGAKVVLSGTKKERTMFHKSGCKPAENKVIKGTGPWGAGTVYEIEQLYPGINHGGYVAGF